MKDHIPDAGSRDGDADVDAGGDANVDTGGDANDTDADNYGQLLDEFGAQHITDAHIQQLPEPHRMLRRRVFYAHRDISTVVDAANSDEELSVITGVGPSGQMHIGHILQFYFAKHLQDTTGARVFIPISGDEKYVVKDELTMADVRQHTLDNLRDLLAVGLDPEKTRIILDFDDADVIYPVATRFADDITRATAQAVYGAQQNVGQQFYPAVQAAHLLLPQLIHGSHASVVPVAIDQDPHVRLTRDIAGKTRYDTTKPAALLSKFMPGLTDPYKMSSSGDEPSITLTDDADTVQHKLTKYAYSGGQSTVEQHRSQGGNPAVDVAFLYLKFFFEKDDAQLATLEQRYRDGQLLTGELKQYAAESISQFLRQHQQRRRSIQSVSDELAAYRLKPREKAAVFSQIDADPIEDGESRHN